jgi:elongation factor G
VLRRAAAAGKRFDFDETKGGVVPREYIPASRRARGSARGGVWPAIRWSTSRSRYYGSYHEVDSSEMAFKIAARWLQGGAEEAPVLLEPVMAVECRARAIHGRRHRRPDVRRGQIQGTEIRGNAQVIPPRCR